MSVDRGKEWDMGGVWSIQGGRRRGLIPRRGRCRPCRGIGPTIPNRMGTATVNFD